jgi:hypothetical protein
MTNNSLSKTPYWDGNAKSFGVYVSKIEAYAKCMGAGDALDPVLMANCPTKSELAVIDVTNPTNMPLVELYKANKMLCAIIVLGQGKSHGIALLGKTKNDDYPNGLAYEFVAKAKKANKPSDASTMIELEIELEKLQLKGTRDFYNDVVGVLDKYEVTKTDHELLMLYCMNHTWISVIIDVEGEVLQGRFANGEELCIEVPDGFHEWYEGDVVLCMNVPLYGTKQAAYCFFKTFASRIKNMTYKQSFAWIGGKMGVFVALVDDVMVLGPPSLVEQVQHD